MENFPSINTDSVSIKIWKEKDAIFIFSEKDSVDIRKWTFH
jgi:hypothetical protein